MKRAFTFMVLLLVASAATAASVDSVPAEKCLSRITLTNGRFLKGYIMSADDSSITWLSKKDYRMFRFGQTQVIPAEQIWGVTKNFKTGFTAGKGMLYGFLGGFVAGFALGLNNPGNCKDDYGNPVKCDFVDRLLSTKNFGASILAGGVLGSAGLVIGIFAPKKQRVQFSINGSRKMMQENKYGLNFQ